MCYDPESDVSAKGTVARSGAQDDGQERAEDTTATVTGTSRDYTMPIEMLGQLSLDGRREPTGSPLVLLLAERAPSEGTRSTRAFEDQPGRFVER